MINAKKIFGVMVWACLLISLIICCVGCGIPETDNENENSYVDEVILEENILEEDVIEEVTLQEYFDSLEVITIESTYE